MGSNGKLQVALGKTSEDEYRPGLAQLSDRIHGNVGLFFTNLPREEVGTKACVMVDPWLCAGCDCSSLGLPAEPYMSWLTSDICACNYPRPNRSTYQSCRPAIFISSLFGMGLGSPSCCLFAVDMQPLKLLVSALGCFKKNWSVGQEVCSSLELLNIL